MKQAETAGADTAEQSGTGVVIVGMGAVTAFGAGVDTLWKGVVSGGTAIGTVVGMDMTGLCADIGGEVPAAARTLPASADGADRDPALEFLLTAAAEAMASSGITVAPDVGGAEGATTAPGAIPAHRWGVLVGSCNGGMQTAEAALRAGDRSADLTLLSPQVLAEALSEEYGITGPVFSVNTACASSAHGVAHAVELIRAGRVDAVLVGGADAFSRTAFAGFHRLGALSASPAAPYSRDRDGLSLGEGSGMLVLTTEQTVQESGGAVLAHVLGYGLSADGYHATAPHPQGEGAARAIRDALDHAGLAAEDVQYINGHGTGTPKNDPAESNAVRAALGEAARNVPLSSTKSMVGHLLGAAGAVEAIVTVQALLEQQLPPTANFRTVDPKCGLDAVPAAVPAYLNAALTNNFAFGGANATLALGSAPKGRPGPRRHAEERVVATGIGAITPAGVDLDALWDAYRAPSARHEAEQEGMRIARVDFDADLYTTRREQRRIDRLGLLAVAAARNALDHAGATADDRTGVVLGTGVGPAESMARFTYPVLESGPDAGSPAVFPSTVYNAAAGQVAQLLGARGATSTLTANHAAGASALCVAFELLRSGHADSVVCLATDLLPEPAEEVYRALPLFGGRSGRGFCLAEAGIAFVLERETTARERGARVLGVLDGYGMTSDARGIGRWDPAGRGIERAMRAAVDEAGHAGTASAAPETVWLNAAGLHAVDRPERAAVERFNHRLDVTPRLLTPKESLGEPAGAGAHLLTALALLSFDRDRDRDRDRGRGRAQGPALVNSSSLGGAHVSLLLRPGTEH